MPATAATVVDAAAHFQAHGWLDLGQVLSAAEVARWSELFDSTQREFPTCWRMHGGPDTTLTADPLVTTPEFDALVRHPRILAAASAALGATARFWETSIRWIAAMGGRSHPDGWHMDFPGGQGYRMAQAMIYLTDTDESTPCLAVTPRGRGEAVLTWAEEDRRHPHVECLGRAGSVWLFDPTCYHTARYRGNVVRKSMQTYFCTAETPMEPQNSPHCVVPRRFWDGSDPAAAEFYRFAPLGLRTRLMREALG
jgi:hypothetical protein